MKIAWIITCLIMALLGMVTIFLGLYDAGVLMFATAIFLLAMTGPIMEQKL